MRLAIVDEYSETLVLAIDSQASALAFPVSQLRRGKEQILNALLDIGVLLHQPRGREWVALSYPKPLAKHLLSAEFLNALWNGIPMLARFQSDKEAMLLDRHIRFLRDSSGTALTEAESKAVADMQARIDREVGPYLALVAEHRKP